ncbi:MAG: ParB/RepB/Spo0J family partition protein [Anaerofustis stercorihominis]|nr:ParB/RepB/Spo0J family partition protein [Anaerofustis stercorihominis]
MAKKGLGKGLDALIPMFVEESYETEEKISPTTIDINLIKPNKDQPRKDFDKEALESLAQSISEHGLIQPIVVMKEDEHYKIIAGERRYRACIMAGIKEVNVIVKDIDDDALLKLALIENLQREDLNPIEEALAYEKLKDDYSMSQAQIAVLSGKSRAAVANTMRLLSLPDEVIAYVKDGKLSSGHARAVLMLENKDEMLPFAEYIMQKELSVRQAETLSKTFGKQKEKEEPIKAKRGSYLDKFEDDLCLSLGTKVKIRDNGEKGKIEIEYYDNDDLARLIALLTGEEVQ